MNKLLLVDLDDTLINSSHFKKALYKSLSKKSHLSEIEIIKRYSLLKISHVLTPHWPEKLADIIAKECEVDAKILLNVMYDQIKSYKINKNVLDYMINFKGIKIIFTTGDSKFQQAKIDHLDLKKHADKVIVKVKDKYLYLHKCIHGNTVTLNNIRFSKVTIIDDRAPLLTSFKAYPWITIIHPNKLPAK